MKGTLILFFSFLSHVAISQIHFGVFAGGSTYLGELNDDVYKRTKPAFGLSLNYELNERLLVRGGVMIASLEGADKYGQAQFVKETRNLSFQSSLSEFSLVGEFNLFNLSSMRWTPYGFAGVAFYRFNPYVRDSGQKIFLKPLGTEGQGIPGSQGKEYKLTQLAIPFGGGLKYAINDDVRLGLEVGLRRLFTDYLDDVSTNYPDPVALQAARGNEAVRFSYRGAEVPGGNATYPDFGFASKGAERGNPKTKDWYYFTGLHLTFRLGGGYGSSFTSKRKGRYGCPVVPM